MAANRYIPYRDDSFPEYTHWERRYFMLKWMKRKKKSDFEPGAGDLERDGSVLDAGGAKDEGALGEEAQPDDVAGAGERDKSASPEGSTAAPVDGVGAGPVEEPGLGEEEEKKAFFRRLRERMHKTRERFTGRLDRLVLGKKNIDADLMDELEEILITSDLGVRAAQKLLERVAERVRRKELKDPDKLQREIQEEIAGILSVDDAPWNLEAHRPCVIMVIGVNGVGKTTTIGKLAAHLKRKGLTVLLVAADTFRAAATEQLMRWGERVDAPVIHQKSGSDPSAVAYDGMDAALARGVDVVLLDTAGRMHTKVNLMDELKKIQRVVKKKIPDAPHEVLLVLDATTGQNALSQARLFKEAIGVTGIVLTKLDGTAKGGVVVAICDELRAPVRYIGIGEAVEDLRPFDPEDFARAIF